MINRIIFTQNFLFLDLARNVGFLLIQGLTCMWVSRARIEKNKTLTDDMASKVLNLKNLNFQSIINFCPKHNPETYRNQNQNCSGQLDFPSSAHNPYNPKSFETQSMLLCIRFYPIKSLPKTLRIATILIQLNPFLQSSSKVETSVTQPSFLVTILKELEYW